MWRQNKAASSLDCQWAQRRDFEQTEQRQRDESCIVQVSYMTCDHVHSQMVDVMTEITFIKKYFLIINIVELDLNMLLL